MRVKGPKPGNKPNKVGVALSVKLGRFDWWTHWPPFCSDRSQNPWGSTFENDMEGMILNEFWRKLGRAIPVCQSSSLENVWAKTRFSFLDESLTSTTVIVTGALLS